jgi:hypothetical protein
MSSVSFNKASGIKNLATDRLGAYDFTIINLEIFHT